MKQYERLQLKFEQADAGVRLATSGRRRKYWYNVVIKLLTKKPTKQILQEQKESQETFKSVL